MTDINEFSSIVIKGFPFIKVVSDPHIMSCCDSVKRIRAYSKEFARMVGPDMQVVNRDAWEAEQALLGHSVSSMARELRKIPMTGALDRMGGQHPALNSVIGRNAVLVKGVGAV